MLRVKDIHRSDSFLVGQHCMLQPLPSASLDYLDPFLLLHHHGPHTFAPGNSGLPFGPHPHRGIETVTFILNGDVAHRDNSGHENTITSGGVQWMSAGRGLIHAEQSSEVFKQNGGLMEMIQLWVNLPAKDKMSEPFYQGWQSADIPKVELDGGKVKIDLISGDWGQYKAAYSHAYGVHLYLLHMQARSTFTLTIPDTFNILFYNVHGNLVANDHVVEAHQLAEFDHDGCELTIRATEDSLLLLGYAHPLAEPMVSHGPFVMNTEAEIRQAYEDYRKGKFGKEMT